MLQVRNLCKEYYSNNKNERGLKVQAVKNVSLTLNDNSSYSLVGESGSGKSTLSRLLTGIEKPTSGGIIFHNKDIVTLGNKELRKAKKDIRIVFQDSYSSLNPRLKIYESIAEPIRNYEKLNRKEEKKRIEFLINQVRLPTDCLNRKPNQFSGGQQKRICIARAIATNPEFIVFDEAVSGLDVTIKKQILDLLLELRKTSKSTYLFITHDIDVALYMSNNIAVMKDGIIVENIENINSLNDFKNEYSKLLIDSLPPIYPEIQNTKLA